jgi:hypothetical protein
MNATPDFREPNAIEQRWIDLLLSVDFNGRSEIGRQLQECHVRPIDENGSLEVRCPRFASKAPVKGRIPVELMGNDVDGVAVHVLLHVVDGLVTEIEVYKDLPTEVLQLPCDWTVLSY